MKKIKKSLFMIFTLSFLLSIIMISASCAKTETKVEENFNYFLNKSDNEISFGVENRSSYLFSKKNGVWAFGGISIWENRNWLKVTEPILFASTVISNQITNVSTQDIANGKKITVSGDEYELIYTITNDRFVKREFNVKFSESNSIFTKGGKLSEGDIRLYIYSKEGMYNFERGFIGNYSEREKLQFVYGAMPVLYSNIYSNDNSLRVSSVLDWYQTDNLFKKGRRYFNDAFQQAQMGYVSINNTVQANKTYTFTDYLDIQNGSGVTYYDQQKNMLHKLSDISKTDFDSIWSFDNRTVNDYEIAVKGLLHDIIDKRATNSSIYDAFTPYAYSGWGEAFAGLEVLRGLARYAYLADDQEMLGKVAELSRAYYLEENSWVSDHEGYGNVIFNQYNNGMEVGETVDGHIGTFKMFSKINWLGDIALFTGDAKLKESYMSLMPVVRNYLVLEDYMQPVDYTTDFKPVYGTEGGGNAGAMAMWGFSQLLAYQISDEADSVKKEYLDDAINSLKKAVSLDFIQMYGIYDEQKPTSVAWCVRGLVRAYELTNNKELLQMAEKVVYGLMHSYYYNSNPYSFFYTAGFLAACTDERYAAFLEMGDALVNAAAIIPYTEDKAILDFYANANYSMLWGIPANAEGIENTHGANNDIFTWVEAKYVPFEFIEGALHDPTLPNYSQIIYRQVKEIYGAGELFNLYALFAARGQAVDKNIVVMNHSAVSEIYTENNQIFRIYNPTSIARSSAIRFPNLARGTYEVIENGKVLGSFTSEQLSNGIMFSIASRMAKTVELKYLSNSFSLTTSTHSAPTILVNNQGNMTNVKVSTSEIFISYELQVNRSNNFDSNAVITYYSVDGNFTDFHYDGETRYYRARAIDESGNATAYTEVSYITASNITIHAWDDFNKITGWTQNNIDFKTEGRLGILNPLENKTSYDVSSISKVFNAIPVQDGAIFEFFPYSKASMAVWSLYIEIGTEKYYLVDKANEILKPVYRFKIDEIIKAYGGIVPLGSVSVKVTLEVEGHNRGFAVDSIRFITEGGNANRFVNVLNNNYDINGNAEYNLNGSLNFTNLQEGKALYRSFSTIELNATTRRYWQIQLEDCRILDRVIVKVADSQGNILINKSYYVLRGLVINIDTLNDVLEGKVFANGLSSYSVTIYDDENAGIYKAPNAVVGSASYSSNSNFSNKSNLIATDIVDTNITFAISTDLSLTPYLKIEINSLTKDLGTQWKLYIRDVETNTVYEMRIAREIENFTSNEDYVRGVSNNRYFREKSGVFEYNIFDITNLTGTRDYEIILGLETGGSIEVTNLILTNSNRLLAVTA